MGGRPHDDTGARDVGDATAQRAYAERLAAISGVRWKRLLHVQAVYQAHVRHLRLGRAVDVGCGIGRNLRSLGPGSVGVDHNPYSVAIARRAGLDARTVDEFFADPAASAPGTYDGLLAAHLVEHLSPPDARAVLGRYVPLVRPGGTVAFITPQERGYRSDPTHVTFARHEELVELAHDLGLVVDRTYSFPFPRVAGHVFVYNEFTLRAHVPA
ncbi:class I SAM-dependent methyltransferase [Cellulomonas fimi]|uniref:class I SAM-dependent methyltransferase n=1 Tax=Cellulomonas fimi TaxID=1708 RepID=UPI00234E268C|nr:class I SAM-dependent methyltransferase [Cellulomonas fimi]MDC7122979.1 class I SAM-dependent methyltransferase [Cellulomonas fimi]